MLDSGDKKIEYGSSGSYPWEGAVSGLEPGTEGVKSSVQPTEWQYRFQV